MFVSEKVDCYPRLSSMIISLRKATKRADTTKSYVHLTVSVHIIAEAH